MDPLELRWRREFDAEQEERLQMQVELARAIYLLKRYAGWVAYDPVEDIQAEARSFLELHEHKPPEWGEQIILL